MAKKGEKVIFTEQHCINLKRAIQARWKIYRKPLAERFWSKVDKRGSDDCWLWKARRSGRGYGMMGIQRPDGSYTSRNASRVAYLLSHGLGLFSIPPEQLVCHKCDNPPCCNPAHLFLGAPGDNINDMIAKRRARYAQADDHYASILTTADVVKIRELYATDSKQSLAKLSKAFGISPTNAHAIVIGRSWKSVTMGIRIHKPTS